MSKAPTLENGSAVIHDAPAKVEFKLSSPLRPASQPKMTDAIMRTRAIFERKIGLSPKELNKISLGTDGSVATTIDDLLIEKIRTQMDGKCSQHGWVIPGTLRIVSRSMCQNEAGRFTGAMVSWVQVEGDVYYPSDKMEVVGEVLKKNKMGMFVVYKNAIQIMIPRDLHLGDEEYDAVQIGQYVNVEIKKSRFQVDDPYILSVGVFKGVVEKPVEDVAAVATTVREAAEPELAAAAAVAAASTAVPVMPPMVSAATPPPADEEEGKVELEEVETERPVAQPIIGSTVGSFL